MTITGDDSAHPRTATATATNSPTKEPTVTITSATTTATTVIDTPSDERADLTADPAHTPTHDLEAATHRVTLSRVVASEWLKFRTVRSNVVAIGGAAVAAVGFGALFSSLGGSDQGPSRLSGDALSLSLGGFHLSQIVIAILGVALVAGEYQTGLIRTWFGAAPDRLRVLTAKVGVYGGLVFVVSLIAAVVAFLAGQALLSDASMALSLSSDGVLQALLGTAFYAASIGVMGIGLGFLLRSTAAGSGAVVTTLMIAPLMVNLLPDSIGDPIGKILPSNAATAVQGLDSTTELLSTGWGIAVLIGWVAAIVGAAAISLKRRDA